MSTALFTTPMVFGILIAFIFVGLCFAGVLSAILYAAKRKTDPELTYKRAFTELAFPSILTFVAISFLIIIKYNFDGPIQIVFLSTIIIAGLFSSIQTKNPAIFFILFAIVFFYLGAESIFKIIRKKYSAKVTEIQASSSANPSE